ncbi:sensor domain-containing phosphodiesterase [Humitalea rosea]|nr:EAL domain-containing protein [Humitalea rosea]
MAEAAQLPGLHGLISAGDASGGDSAATIRRALNAVRSHLGMEVAYVSEFVDNRSVFREVDAPGQEARIKVGDSHSLDDVYCRHILEGRLPELIPDTAAEPLALSLPITGAVPIGAHMSVPIRLPNGRLYGMFCCLGFLADASLNKRDLQMMKVFAEMTAFEIGREADAADRAAAKRARVTAVMEQDQLTIAYQPIWDIETGRPVGLECLSRFSATPIRPPDIWFAEAAEAGLGIELEVFAIRKALAALPSLPDDVYVAVNASPETMLSEPFLAALDGMPMDRIVLEITEHARISDYKALSAVLTPLRHRGARLAVDDTGSGYSGLHHILQLRPDIIKLDRGLIQGIDGDTARQALASALMGFARETDGVIIAEGVETPEELATLRALGVGLVQGYLLGRPLPLDRTQALFAQAAEARRA